MTAHGGMSMPDPSSLVTRASAVRSRSIRWAWKGWLPIGYPVVQTGVEGLGKSVFAAWLIAQLTRGRLDGDWGDEPVTALIVGDEDGIEDTWKPRLDLAGADLERVGFLNLDKLPGWNLRDGIETLQAVIADLGARVVFIDSLLDHLPPPRAGESVNSPTWVRAGLRPLKQLTRDLGLVAIYSMHPPKAKSADYRDLVQASQAFSAVPRVGLLFAYHPHDDASNPGRRRVLLRGKGNLGRDPGALEFRVVARPYEHDDGHVQEREHITNVEPSTVTLLDLAPDKRAIGAREPTKTEQAADYLRDALRGGEWRPARPIIDALTRQGLGSDSVVNGACRDAVVEKRKQHEQDGRWEWRIPPSATDVGALEPSASRARGPSGGWSLPLETALDREGSTLHAVEQDGADESKAPSLHGLRARESDLEDRAERLARDHADIAARVNGAGGQW